MNQAPHLRWEAVQFIVAHMQVQQIRQVNEQLIGYVVNASKKNKKIKVDSS